MSSNPLLEGRRILVLDDNVPLAESMRFALEEHGCTVVGPAATADEALELLAGATVDCAVLDVDLAGRSSAPVAEALREHGIPFVFLTGHGDSSLLPGPLRGWRRLSKPVDPDELARVLAAEIDGPAA